MKSTARNLARSRKKKALKLLERNRYGEALPILEALCRAAPQDGEAWLMLGATQGQLGNIQAAIHCSERAATIMPANVRALDNLALGYHCSGAIEKACSVWERRLILEPQHRETVNRLAHGFMSLGQNDKAIAIYRQFLATRPDDYQMWINLGAVYEFEGALTEAEHCYRRTLELKPGLSVALQNLANVLSAQGKTDAAIESYRAALESDPGNSVARSNYLLTLHYKAQYSALDVYREHVEKMSGDCIAEDVRTFQNELDTKRPLRVGFVSPDMRAHSVACFFEALLGAVDSNECTSYCYSDSARPDATTARLRRLSDHWRDTAGTDIRGICSRIFSDQIDILIDLAGHTSSRNMAILAARPAPVQITWLGYPNTTGLRCVDYRLTDAHADPEDDSTPGTEELVRLDGSFLCYQPPSEAPRVSALPAGQNGFVTFGSFNNLAKLNDQVLALWARLLAGVANARLYLKNPSFTDETTRDRYRGKLIDLGISPDRLTLTGRTHSREEHLQLYSNVDIGLDCFPYNGTTTTCEALWMGIPVVAKQGYAHAGRVGVSLLNAVGHPEWIGQDDEAYLQIATNLAADIDTLADTRDRLRDDMGHSLLCDSTHFAMRFTQTLREIWVKHCVSANG